MTKLRHTGRSILSTREDEMKLFDAPPAFWHLGAHVGVEESPFMVTPLSGVQSVLFSVGRGQWEISVLHAQKVLAIRDRENNVLSQIEIPFRANPGIRFG
jgi:hypothetical protein